jgi:3-oxoacyl-[acyl-carrier-protein] synthase II
MDTPRPRIVVTGVGAICAAGRDTTELLATLLDGGTAVAPSRRCSADFDDCAVGEVSDEWIADATSPAELDRFGRDVLMSLIACREALRQAGLRPATPAARAAGLVIGKCQGLTYGSALPSDWIHWTADSVAARLGLAGPRQTVGTACAAGGNAVGIAMDRIFAGDADVVLAGGVDTLQVRTFAGFRSVQAVDSEPCSPYGRSGGLNLGEGAAFLVLERAESAAARGATVLAEVLGYGLSADAYHPTAPDPTGLGATLAVSRALAGAGIGAASVSYVSGHGTGTRANDTVERRVMRSVFGPRVTSVPVVGTKSFVGHTLGAAGAIEAVVSVLSLVHDVIPPTANFADEDAADLDFVPNKPRPAQVDVVLSNNYAFGGNNVSVVLAKPGRRVLNGRAGRAPDPYRNENNHSNGSREAVITGIGLLGRPGIGADDWLATLAAGTADGDYGAEADRELARQLAATKFAAAATWRQMNDFTRLCAAAVRLAVQDAGLPMTRESRRQIGLLLGTMAGPAEFADPPGDEPPADQPVAKQHVRPFTQSTLNAPAGAICKELGIRGPTTTIVSGGISGTLVLESALDAIRLGRSDAIIVVAAEESCPAIDHIYRAIGTRSPDGRAHPYAPGAPGTSSGTAAVALVVEERSVAQARAAAAYGRIAGISHTSDNYHAYRFDGSGERYAAAMRTALDRAGVSPADIGVVSGCATGTDLDLAEAAALRRIFPPAATVIAPKSVTGESEAASGLVNVAIPLLASRLRSIRMPTFGVGEPEPPGGGLDPGAWAPVGPARYALATSASFGASFGAAVIEMCGS